VSSPAKAGDPVIRDGNGDWTGQDMTGHHPLVFRVNLHEFGRDVRLVAVRHHLRAAADGVDGHFIAVGDAARNWSNMWHQKIGARCDRGGCFNRFCNLTFAGRVLRGRTTMARHRRTLGLAELQIAQLDSFAFKRLSGDAAAAKSCYLGDGDSLDDGDEICLNSEVWVCSDGSLVRKKPAEYCT